MRMALIKRKSAANPNGSDLSTSLSEQSDQKKTSSGLTSAMIASIVTAILGAIGYTLSSGLFPAPAAVTNPSSKFSLRQQQSGKGENYQIDENVQLILNLEDDASNIPLGPHTAILHAKKSLCPNLGFWLRFEGDALGTVFMKEQGDQWKGSFTFPLQGSYDLVAYWKGCHNENTLKKLPLKSVVSSSAPSSPSIQSIESSSSMYPHSAWISSKKFKNVSKSTPYIWHNPLIPTNEAHLMATKYSLVSKEGATFGKTGFYSFAKLSNYELVCWVGSKSAADSRTVFLEEKNSISSAQRPFKFHIYPSINFEHPVEDWLDTEQARFRKCKHILVSLDEIKTPLTQQEYANQVTIFFQHLQKAFPDETFPIWMFTVNESPMTPTNCLPPYILPRTSDHPCNDVLKDLFDSQKTSFPERVHLLDNTAISLPQLGGNEEDVKAAAALRIFVLVGKKVMEWRESGQVGREDGLHRGGKVEANFELIPYAGWQ